MTILFRKLFGRQGNMTMRVSILTLFLSLTLLAFGISLSFLYYKNYRILSLFAKKTVQGIGVKILEKVEDLFAENERLIKANALLIDNASALSSENKWLQTYMLRDIRYHPYIPYFFIGTTSGNYFEVGNLSVSVQSHYLTDPSKPLPKDAAYESQSITRMGAQVESTNEYYDRNLKQVGTEKGADLQYDPRDRPWYKVAVKTKTFRWTEVYTFYDTGDPGITAAQPIYNSSGELVGVVGADLSFQFLSQYLANENVGKSGKPFILDRDTGKLILPSPSLLKASPIGKETIFASYQQFKKTNQEDFEFTINKIRYIAHVQPLSIQENLNWLIVIIVPFEDLFGELRKSQIEALSIILLICAISSFLIAYFAKKLSAPIISLAKEVDRIKRLDLEDNERIDTHIHEIFLMDSSVHSMKLAFRSFIHYVPKEIVKELLSQDKELTLGGEKKKVTILFSDIADFTSISESMPTETLMSLLAEYFDGLSKIILQSQGTIDKYVGDGIMAFWGAPIDVPHHAATCAEAALLCTAFVRKLNERRLREKKPPFYTRFGINTGTVIVGNIGTPERMNYTLIGDAVNAAARLQPVNKTYHTSIIISEEVVQELGDAFLVRRLDTIEVKGKKQKINIFELVGKKEGPEEIRPTSKEIFLCKQFEKATEAFRKNDRLLAKRLFEEILKEFPNDGPTQLYLQRLQDS